MNEKKDDRDDMYLLVMDLDECLIAAEDYQENKEYDFLILGRWGVVKRPGLDEFLSRVNELFRLAVWTSATQDYAQVVIDNIMPFLKLEFVFTRDRCTPYHGAKSEIYDLVYLKDLKKVKRKGYDLAKVIAIDDNPKGYQRHRRNLISVMEFTGDKSDRELAVVLKRLESRIRR